jgi:hypothetical protein
LVELDSLGLVAGLDTDAVAYLAVQGRPGTPRACGPRWSANA